MRPHKAVMERNTHTEIFLEIAWKTPSEYESLLAMQDVKDKPERIKAFGIGITRGELISSVKAWDALIDEERNNKEASYSRKITNLKKAGLIEEVNYPFKNKKIRYVLSKKGIIKTLMSMVLNNKAALLKLSYGKERIEGVFEILPDSKNFDNGIWKLFIGYLREVYRYRYDAKDYPKLATHYKERDAQVTQSSIKEFLVHFIFRQGMLYHSSLMTGKSTNFFLGGHVDNSYYNEFLKLCWYYIGNNVLKFELASPFLDVDKTKINS